MNKGQFLSFKAKIKNTKFNSFRFLIQAKNENIDFFWSYTLQMNTVKKIQ